MEAQLGSDILHCGGEDDTSERCPHGRNRQGKRAVALKVRAHDGHTRHKGNAEAKADTDPLCQEKLPVLGGHAGHKGSQDGEKTASAGSCSRIAGVRQPTG